ncbi:hypothetical protein HMPREF9431_01090 [Segatella oulorum F0390]|uniref:RHS repeat-associated core domain-containing protein n=1 Tax=Segatella oulorum F0390 TaxID=702438 RepID=G1WB89_9BACT|nr:hypothetical protein HMPREF9431_01090 [Segatella oulorum F0390]
MCVLNIICAVDAQSLTNGNPTHLGGTFKHSYAYDDLNRLASTNGKTKHVFV